MTIFYFKKYFISFFFLLAGSILFFPVFFSPRLESIPFTFSDVTVRQAITGVYWLFASTILLVPLLFLGSHIGSNTRDQNSDETTEKQTGEKGGTAKKSSDEDEFDL